MLKDATRGHPWGPRPARGIHLPLTLVELGRETRTTWYIAGAPVAEAWIWYGPGLAYKPWYDEAPDDLLGVPSTWA